MCSSGKLVHEDIVLTNMHAQTNNLPKLVNCGHSWSTNTCPATSLKLFPHFKAYFQVVFYTVLKKFESILIST